MAAAQRVDDAAPPADDGVVAKGEFARLINVSPGRVSQYIKEGKLTGAALVGAGRNARVAVAEALAQLRIRLDPVQMAGNGLDTRLDAAPRPAAARAPEPADETAEAIKQERLRQLQRQRQREEEEALARRGVYVRADAVKAEMNRLAAQMMATFEGMLPNFAAAMAARFELSQRDVLHLLRTEFRSTRSKAAARAAAEAESRPALVPDAAETPPPEGADE